MREVHSNYNAKCSAEPIETICNAITQWVVEQQGDAITIPEPFVRRLPISDDYAATNAFSISFTLSGS